MAKIESNRCAGYELRFQPLVHDSPVFVFPCDPEGHVDMDALSDADKLDYLYARVLVGREFAAPDVYPAGYH
jgi:hypothetical protein